MLADVKKVTSALQKITELTAGDKTIPGVMFELTLDEVQGGNSNTSGTEVDAGLLADFGGGVTDSMDTVLNPPAEDGESTGEEDNILGDATLKICYSDNRKNFIEYIKAKAEKGDLISVPDQKDSEGKVVVEYEQLKRIMDNCQSSGKIIIDDFRIIYGDGVLHICVKQYFNVLDSEGRVTGRSVMGEKRMDIACFNLEKDMKAKTLLRPKYDAIFEGDQYDVYEKVELADALSRTAVEKGKNIYFAQSRQEVFVPNQAHMTSYTISKLTPSESDMQILKTELEQINPDYTEEDFVEYVTGKQNDTDTWNRMHFSLVIPQAIAKAIASIISKLDADDIYISKVDNKFCNVYVDNDTEKMGISFEMPAASATHITRIAENSALGYKSYQLSFMREFLVDLVKSALNSTKSEKVELKFETDATDAFGRPVYELVVDSGSASASISDTHRLMLDEYVDINNNLAEQKFNISLKVLADMLAQLKTDRIAFDFEVNASGTTNVRIAEIDFVKNQEQYLKARSQVADGEVTPPELKLDYRLNTLGVKQFTTLAK